MFEEKVFAYDQLSKLDKWKTTMLLRIKETIAAVSWIFCSCLWHLLLTVFSGGLCVIGYEYLYPVSLGSFSSNSSPALRCSIIKVLLCFLCRVRSSGSSLGIFCLGKALMHNDLCNIHDNRFSVHFFILYI